MFLYKSRVSIMASLVNYGRKPVVTLDVGTRVHVEGLGTDDMFDLVDEYGFVHNNPGSAPGSMRWVSEDGKLTAVFVTLNMDDVLRFGADDILRLVLSSQF